MSIKDTVLTINAVEPGLVNAVNRHAQEMGRELKGLVLVDKTYAEEAENRPKDKTGLFQEIICDFGNADELQKALLPYEDRLLAVVCRFESSIQPLRKVIPFIPYVNAPTESSLLWSTEKPLMRNRLSTFDRNLTPKYQYLEAEDISSVSELIKDFSYPVIVKPSSLAASLLVTLCEDEAALRECLKNTFKVIEAVYIKEHRRSKPSVLVEEFMRGTMYSTDAYVNSKGDVYCLPLVRVITAHEAGLPGFYGYRCIIPTDVPEEEVALAFTAARAAVHALNLRSTTAHIEMYQTANGWKIIELGARMGGYREDLYREAYGVDHYYNDLAIRMDKEPIMPTEPIGNAGCLNLYADEEGTIESIEGIDEAKKLESIKYISVHAEPGDEAIFASNGGRLIVDSVLSNKDAQQLEKDVNAVIELTKINIRKSDKALSLAFYHSEKFQKSGHA